MCSQTPSEQSDTDFAKFSIKPMGWAAESWNGFRKLNYPSQPLATASTNQTNKVPTPIPVVKGFMASQLTWDLSPQETLAGNTPYSQTPGEPVVKQGSYTTPSSGVFRASLAAPSTCASSNFLAENKTIFGRSIGPELTAHFAKKSAQFGTQDSEN